MTNLILPPATIGIIGGGKIRLVIRDQPHYQSIVVFA